MPHDVESRNGFREQVGWPACMHPSPSLTDAMAVRPLSTTAEVKVTVTRATWLRAPEGDAPGMKGMHRA